MNEEKTELMVINKTTNVLGNFKQFKIKTQSIKYLGCNISAHKSQLYKDNYLPLIKNVKLDVERWSDIKVNLMGRINLVVAKISLYLSDYLYYPTQIFFFKEVNSVISSFIWSNRAHRLKMKLLHYSRQEGGLNLPNLELYYNAAQMFDIDQIINNKNEAPWIDIENAQLQRNSLLLALFSKKN